MENKGTPGIEPGTSRSAVECSTPELYPPRFEGRFESLLNRFVSAVLHVLA